MHELWPNCLSREYKTRRVNQKNWHVRLGELCP